MKSGRAPDRKRVNPYPVRLYLIFLLMAVVSLSGLDYISWHKGERSFFFTFRERPFQTAKKEALLGEIIPGALAHYGVPGAALAWPPGDSEIPQLVIRVPLESYASLAPRLERFLLDKDIFLTKEEKREDGEVTFLWRVENKKGDRLSLLFICGQPPAPERKVRLSTPPGTGRAAIIIDDMGFSVEALQQIGDMNIPITVAILPLSPFARQAANLAHQKGIEVMLHLPCESLNHQDENDGLSTYISSGMDEAEIKRLTEDFLARVPFIQGVNNHMGSKITQEPSVLRPVLELIAERQLYFVDSRTTPNSIAFDLAKRLGIRSAFRNIFLDTSVSVDFSKQKLIELLQLAKKTGSAIAIGHPFPETLRALQENLHLFKEFGVEPVYASQIVR